MINNVWMLAAELVKLPEILGRFDQGLSTIFMSHEIQDLSNADDIIVKKGKIEFKDVHFGYRKDSKIFKGLSLTFEPGEKVGLVGQSGSGKTTLINLILRYYDITSGSIKIDDQDIGQVTQTPLGRPFRLFLKMFVFFTEPSWKIYAMDALMQRMIRL